MKPRRLAAPPTPPAARAEQSRVVHEAPDRLAHAVLVPQRAVGEADLAPDRPLAARDPCRVHARGHLVGPRHVERRIARRERGDRLRRAERRDQLFRELVHVSRFPFRFPARQRLIQA
jgi:hypothetical protein